MTNCDVQGYVAAALAALEHPSRYREAHAYILAHAAEALPVLLAALDGTDERLACAAAQVLGTLDDADSMAAALSPLGHQALYGRASVATAAVCALSALPVTRAAVLTLEEALRSEHATVRLEAALGLARLGAQGTRPLERRAASALAGLDPADVPAAVGASLSRLEPGARSVLIPVALSLNYEGALAALRDGLARRSTAADAEEVLVDPATLHAICRALTPGNAAQAAPALAAAGAVLRGSAAAEPAAAATEEAVGALVTTLYAVHDPLERAPLLAALQSFGEPALRLLGERLADEEPAHVGALAQVLAEIGWRPGTDKAAARFWIARGRWEDALVAGPDAIAPLVEAFLSGRGEPRRAAAEALERLNWTPTEDRLLVPFLMARNRWRALAALGPRAVPGLAAELEASRQGALAGAAPPDEADTRVRIIGILAAANAAEAAPPLAAALVEDPSAAVRTAALHALCQGGRADADTLARALRAEIAASAPDSSAAGHEASAELRAEIIAAIGETGSADAVELLMQALRADPDPAARASAAAALAALHGREPEAVTAAAARLLDAGDGLAAGTLLARIDGPLVDRLVAQLGSSEPERVSQAIAALAAFARGGGDLAGPLRKSFLEGSAEERLAAARVCDRVDALPAEADVQAAYWLAKGRLDRCLALGAVAVPVLAAAIPRYEWRTAAAMTVALLQLRPEPEPPVVEEMIQRLGAVASLPSQAPAQAPPLAPAEPGARTTPVIVSHDEERSAARAYLGAIANLRRPGH